MRIIPVKQEESVAIYSRLLQCYEAEFSSITKKKPDSQGIFPLDTELGGDIEGFLVYEEGHPAGFVAIACKPNHQFEVLEFYIVPCFRRNSLGKRFVIKIWEQYRGTWEVKQIQGADSATLFWRKAIGEFTNQCFKEDVYQDPYWGEVTRQVFSSIQAKDS